MRRLKFLVLFFWALLLLGLSLWRYPVPLTGAWPLLRAAAAAALLLLAALANGHAVLGRFKLFHGSYVEEAGYSLAAGLLALSLLGSALELLGVLYGWVVLGLLALLFIVHWEHLETLADGLRRSLKSKHPWQGSSEEVATVLTLALSAGVVLLLCLAPPTFYDALVYHLAQAQRAAVTGADAAQADVLFTWLPSLPQPLWTLALLLAGTPLGDATAPALLNFAAFGLMGLMLLDCGARLFEERRLWLVPALALTQPLLALSFGVFTPDGWMALYAFLSLNAFLLGLAERVLRGQAAWLLLSALFAGAAVAAKPVALTHAAALLLLLALLVLNEPALRRLRLLLGGVALFLLPLLPWLLRGALRQGQPVYPFPLRLFGFNLGAGAAPAYFEHVRAFGGQSFSDWFRLPYRIFFDAAGLGGGGHLSFLLLALAPAALAWRLGRELRWTALYLLLGALLWASGPHVLRYGVYLVPAAALVAAHGALEAERWAVSRTWTQLWRGLLLLGLALGSLHTLGIAVMDFDPVSVALGIESKDRYLERWNEPAPKVQAWIRAHGGGAASKVLLLGDARTAWLPAGTTAASVFENHPLAAWMGAAASPQDLDASLRRKGYDFVVFNAAEWERQRSGGTVLAYWPAEDSAAWQRFFDWIEALKALPPGRRLLEPGLLVARLR